MGLCHMHLQDNLQPALVRVACQSCKLQNAGALLWPCEYSSTSKRLITLLLILRPRCLPLKHPTIVLAMLGWPHPGMPSSQDIEANLLKQDIAKAKQKEQQDQPAAVAKALELNDAAALRRRGRMMLPAPQACPYLLWKHSSPLQVCSDLKGASGNLCLPSSR